MRAEVESEARRVATAFGIRKWTSESDNALEESDFCWYKAQIEWIYIRWRISLEPYEVDWIEAITFGTDGNDFRIVRRRNNQTWETVGNALEEMMARGLYRLGISDEGVWSQLPAITAHERLELRLSMPREFWPFGWEDEE